MLKRFFKPKHITLEGITFTVKYTVRRNMRRMLLRIEKKGEIKISLPKALFSNVNAFILEHENWIIEQHSQLTEPFSEGSVFYFKAKKYIISHHTKALSLKEGKVLLNPTRAQKQSNAFYTKEAKSYLPVRLEYFKNLMNLEFSELRFYCSKRKWGSCNSKKAITLSPYMMKLNDEMIDYILVHELAHLKHMNHSKDFYSFVEEFTPEYKRISKEINVLSKEF